MLTRFDRAARPHGNCCHKLGVVLLELCFGKLLDEHANWQRPLFAAARRDPMVRHFIGCQWPNDVEGEAGEKCANAVRYCLQQPPAGWQGDKWREEFVQSVVWPLQKCGESMQPSKTII